MELKVDKKLDRVVKMKVNLLRRRRVTRETHRRAILLILMVGQSMKLNPEKRISNLAF